MPVTLPQDPSVAFDSLPGSVKAFLVSANTGATFKKLVTQHGVTEPTVGAVVDLVGDIDLGFLKLENLVPGLIELGIPREKATRFAADLAGYRYLPISRFVGGDVWNLIESWGGDPKKYPTTTIEIREATPESVTDEILKESRIALGARLTDRFRHVLLSRFKGIRSDAELRELLARPEKVGGLGIATDDAERIVGMLRLKLASTKITEVTTPPPRATPHSPLPTPYRTAENIEKKIAESIASIIHASKITFSLPETKIRFENLVRTRLRDVRNADDVRAALTAPQKNGGLGLPSIAAEKVGQLIEAEHAALTSTLHTEKKREAEAISRTSAQGVETRTQDKRAKELKELEERFIALAGKSKLLKEREVLLPPVKMESGMRNQELGTEPKRPELKSVLSPASIKPVLGTKPRIEDVKFSPKLTGPVEELRGMTIVEFRRLSKDAKEATLKVRDKIDLVKEQGHEKYVAAVRGWKESEPSRLYLELSRKALETGTPIPTLVAERESQNLSTLTVAEFQAILSLNAGLRF